MSQPINPLAKKLQVKPGKHWLFYKAPDSYLATLEPLPESVKVAFTPVGSFDGAQLFVIDSADLAATLKIVVPLLQPDAVIWVTYPKKSSGIKTDLGMTADWVEAARFGLTPVASAAVDENWTAIRLKPEGQSKTSKFSNEEVKNNEHSTYIDLKNRQINLPPDMKVILEKSTAAMNFFQSLSFTNKKEYVVWILSAKQEKTKTDRLEKITEKLLAGKKNPSEK